MMEIQMVWTWLQAHHQTLQSAREDSDRGSDIVQYAIITAAVAAAAIVIVGILVGKAKSAADGVKTQ